MSTETWYVLEDDSVADPNEIAMKNGRLQHKDGRAVAHAPHGPRTRSVNADAERAKSGAERRAKLAEDAKKAADKAPYQAKSPQASARDMKPEASSQFYKTRDMKND